MCHYLPGGSFGNTSQSGTSWFLLNLKSDQNWYLLYRQHIKTWSLGQKTWFCYKVLFTGLWFLNLLSRFLFGIFHPLSSSFHWETARFLFHISIFITFLILPHGLYPWIVNIWMFGSRSSTGISTYHLLPELLEKGHCICCGHKLSLYPCKLVFWKHQREKKGP